jgi:hypothetical protein
MSNAVILRGIKNKRTQTVFTRCSSVLPAARADYVWRRKLLPFADEYMISAMIRNMLCIWMKVRTSRCFLISLIIKWPILVFDGPEFRISVHLLHFIQFIGILYDIKRKAVCGEHIFLWSSVSNWTVCRFLFVVFGTGRLLLQNLSISIEFCEIRVTDSNTLWRAWTNLCP